MDHENLILDYYRCFKNRDRKRLEELLVDDFIHLSPYGRFQGRDSMLDTIWPEVGKTHAEGFEIFGKSPEFMVRYRHCSDGSPRLAEWIRFDGDRIKEIEVYLGSGAVPSLENPKEPEV